MEDTLFLAHLKSSLAQLKAAVQVWEKEGGDRTYRDWLDVISDELTKAITDRPALPGEKEHGSENIIQFDRGRNRS